MKILNIIPLLIALAIFQSCNPLEDDIDALGDNDKIVTDLIYTLESDDYDSVGKTFGNFSSEDSAKLFIPQILTNNYPQFGEGSSALITYDIFSPVRINDTTDSTLTEDDYAALGQDFGTLSSNGDIFEAAEYVHGEGEDNDVVTLTYEWFCFGCPDQGTLTSKVTRYDGSWYVAYTPTDEEYTLMGQNFPNFSSRSEGREKIGKFLTSKFIFDEVETIRTAVFTYTFVDGNDVRQFVDFMTVYQFNGTEWVPFEDVVSATLQLGNDGTAWIPDNTIKYSLVGADYDAIVTASETDNAAGSSNLAQFGNFNLNSWSDEQLEDYIGAQLANVFPVVEGQKYLVSYDFYNGSNGVGTILFIGEDGAYVVVK